MDQRSGGRSITDRLFGWARRPDRHRDEPAEPRGQALPSKVFPRFLASLSNREAPVLLDLGPVVGSNVSFFGERLGCKLFVEDLFGDVERFAREQRGPGSLAEHLSGRFPQPDASVDGILCWDVIDYLDRPSAQILGRALARLLKPGGALLAFFSTTPPAASANGHYTKYVVLDERTLEHRTYPATRKRYAVTNNRDVARLFDGLRVTEQFLLLTKMREVLLRK